MAELGFCCCTGLSLAVASRGPLSSCGKQASHCGGFSCCGAQALGHTGFGSCSTWASSCSSQALEHRFSSGGTWVYLLCSMWDLSKSGLNPCLLHWKMASLPPSHQGSLESSNFLIPANEPSSSKSHIINKQTNKQKSIHDSRESKSLRSLYVRNQRIDQIW